jgi:hypothetical protein
MESGVKGISYAKGIADHIMTLAEVLSIPLLPRCHHNIRSHNHERQSAVVAWPQRQNEILE